jgi:hypothetical protein
MRLNYATLVAAFLLLGTAPAIRAYDAVDDLLASGPVDVPVTAADHVDQNRGHAFDTPSDALSTHDSSRVQPHVHPFATHGQPSAEISLADSATSTTADHKPATTWHVDAVPEPSALAMAVVAMLFFLLFGRRRAS